MPNAYDSTISTIEGVLTSGIRTVIPGGTLLPGIDRIIESLADIENRQFFLESAPVVSGDGSLTISSDALSYSQSARHRNFAYIPMSSRAGLL